ncbi:hypothetical protein BDN71DRAFT_5198 [Pleurotus eryngii]|uniref:Uncharacterized protein n=1 Tax=Pleurotus eryngii TaxID=5323 RepID=A0A9P6ABC8_PLEER|nr:hypothetical protein BDN71DRAFT_5198 [Pleurotus eryngii]
MIPFHALYTSLPMGSRVANINEGHLVEKYPRDLQDAQGSIYCLELIIRKVPGTSNAGVHPTIYAGMDPDKQNEKHEIIEGLLVTPWFKVNSTPSPYFVALNAVGPELYLTSHKGEKQIWHDAPIEYSNHPISPRLDDHLGGLKSTRLNRPPTQSSDSLPDMCPCRSNASSSTRIEKPLRSPL